MGQVGNKRMTQINGVIAILNANMNMLPKYAGHFGDVAIAYGQILMTL